MCIYLCLYKYIETQAQRYENIERNTLDLRKEAVVGILDRVAAENAMEDLW